MIKLYLPDGFENHEEIQNIYDRLANKIYDQQGPDKITYTYQGEQGSFDSPASIKRFLLAKDFYGYKIYKNVGFMHELMQLRGNVKLSSVIHNTSTSEKVRLFCKKYGKADNQQFYEYLQGYEELTISKLFNEFRQKGLHREVFEGQKICRIFDYKQLQAEERHEILNRMDIPVCPYCNMNYTTSFGADDRERNTADIDHFYLKSEYPEYALCLFNFVPACPVCNQKIKGTKSMTRETHVYPHQEGFEGKSHFQVRNLLDILLGACEHAEIELKSQKDDCRVKHSMEDFKLNERYKVFAYVAEELIEKAQIYNDAYAESLSQTIRGSTDKTEESLSQTIRGLTDKTSVKYAVFGAMLSEEEYGKLSLGKLKQDILRQLRVFD